MLGCLLQCHLRTIVLWERGLGLVDETRATEAGALQPQDDSGLPAQVAMVQDLIP